MYGIRVISVISTRDCIGNKLSFTFNLLCLFSIRLKLGFLKKIKKGSGLGSEEKVRFFLS